MFGFLNKPGTIDSLLDKVESQLHHQQRIKFYAMILDLHSDRYLCNDCQESMFYWYRPQGELLQKIIASITQRGHKVQTKSGTLDSIIRVSALKPPAGQHEIPAQQHQTDPIDIKEYRHISEVLVIERNDTAIDEDNLTRNQIFTSSKLPN